MPTPKTIPIKPVTSWSFSRWNIYTECPAKFKYKNIDKLPEPSSPAMARGSAIHKLAEDYVKGLIKKLPAELKLFEEEFKAAKSQKVKYVEEDWAFKKDWSQTDWRDWTGAWLRVKLDLGYVNIEHNVGVPIDHKTGKFRASKNAEYEMQLELYALAMLKRLPELSGVSPRLWYLDEGVVYPEEEKLYERKDEKYLEKLWQGRVKKLLSDTTFKPTPGHACTYCHYKKANDGPCKF